MNDNYLVINGVHYPVTSSWVDRGPTSDGRRRWGIVTEGEMHAAETGRQSDRADASVSECAFSPGQCKNPACGTPAARRERQRRLSRDVFPDPDADLGHAPVEGPTPGSLYDGKCEECTTGISCEEARGCLFEG